MKQTDGSRIGWPVVVNLLLFEVAYLIAYYFVVATREDLAAPVLFTDAVLLCGLLLSRPSQWWLYILATVPIDFLLHVPDGPSLWFALASCTSDSLKALFAAWLLRRFSKDRGWFDNVQEFSKYCLVAVVLAPVLSAFAAAASRAVLGHGFWLSFTISFLSAALAGLVFAPFILLVVNTRLVHENVRYVEAFYVAAGLVLAAFVAFSRGPNGAGFPSVLLFLLIPFWLWAAMRFGPIGASGSLLLTGVLFIVSTMAGRGPFHSQSNEGSVVSLQLFLFVASVPFMFLSVIAFEQRKALRESEERFRAMVDVVPVMLWMSGTDARCTFFNKSWLDFTGLTLKEQSEEDWVGRVYPKDRKRCVDEYLAAFKSRETFNLEYRLLRNDGVYRWVIHNGVPRYAADGTFRGYVGSRIDYTDHRKTEEQVRAVSTQLINEQELERYRIGYELHEELAQKLCALSLGLSRFSRWYGETSDMAADIGELQQQLSTVLNDVVSLSRQLRPTAVEGVGLSAALRKLCRQTADGQRAVLFARDENLPRLPKDVSLALYWIAEESLRNAFAHSRATHIRMELSAAGSAIRLSVRDNGCGFVVARNTKPAFGLSRMSERVTRLGGDLSIVSSPGEGTAVVATMPLRESMTVSSTA